MDLNFENIGPYLKTHPSSNACGHHPRAIKRSDFEKIGDLYDDSYGNLSYLEIRKEGIVFVGAYPLIDCDILKCKKCDQVVFYHLNQGGIAPRPECFLADYHLNYLSEPAVKSVNVNKEHFLNLIQDFGLEFKETNKNLKYQAVISIKDITESYIFNYKEYRGKDAMIVNFDLVGKRALLRAVHQWIQKNNSHD